MNNFGLGEKTVREITDYFKQNPYIETVKIYGSRAKGNFRPGSDIDFAIWLAKGGNISRISGDLENLPTPYKFDVTDYKSLSHEGMKKSIDTDGIIFYEKRGQNPEGGSQT